jgi:CDP-diacylglycerol pyrophosphatase
LLDGRVFDSDQGAVGMADSRDRGITRSRSLITAALVGVGILLGVGVPTPWTAHADPEANFVPPHDCGGYNDSLTDPRLELWKDIKGATPAKPSPFIFVNDSWGLKNGNRPGEKYKWNLLAIPRARVTGVECADTYGPKAFNLWRPAWDEAMSRFKGQVDTMHLMLGINSLPGRRQDQLHIHLTALKAEVRKELDATKGIPTDLSKWNTSIFPLVGKAFRIVRVNDLNANVFKLVHDNITQNDSFEQSIAVVAAPGNGFYIINTQGKPKLHGEPQHNPEVHVGSDWGSESIEDLIDRG